MWLRSVTSKLALVNPHALSNMRSFVANASVYRKASHVVALSLTPALDDPKSLNAMVEGPRR